MPHRRLDWLVATLVTLLALTLLGACGGGDAGGDESTAADPSAAAPVDRARDADPDESVILATVGDREITRAYYIDRLGRLQQDQLPRDDDGQVRDMSTLEGKLAFLDVIIDKELMVSKALQLGYDQDTGVQAALANLVEYNAMGFFWQDEIGDPSKYVSEDDLDHYYSRLGETRSCDYLIADFRSEAEQALAEYEAGTPWAELVAKYHSAPQRPDRPPRVDVSWGQYRDEFEAPVFAVDEGELAGPIETEYGWWVLRVNEVTREPKPDLEAIKAKVLASIAQRNQNLRRQELTDSVRQERNFHLDEDALAIVYAGLPDNEQVIDPQTNEPVPREQLQPLRVPTESYSRVLVSYDLSTGPFVLTIGDFKAQFDRQNAFERPKKSQLLGGLRTKLTNGAERAIMIDEARQRGYFEDPRVLREAHLRIEEMLVDKVHADVVSYEEYVSQEEMEQFFAEYGHQYHRPERRSGHMVRCADLATAQQARRALVDEGETWKVVNRRYGNDPQLEQQFGRFVPIRSDETGPLRDQLFALEVGDVSQPFEVEGGVAVVQLDRIDPPETPTLDEVSDAVAQRIRNRRKDAALRSLIDQWTEEFGVTIHEERVAELPSWDEVYQQVQREKLAMPGGVRP